MGAWEEARRKGIGGSDWQQTEELGGRCTRALILDKRKVAPDYPDDVEKLGFFARGHALEPLIKDLAQKQLNIKIHAAGKAPKSNLPSWWLGNPDGRIVGGGIWEGKSKGPWPFKKMQREGVFVGEVMQVNHYMALYKQDYAVHSTLEPVSWQCIHNQLQFDEGMVEDMIVLGERIWKMVTDGPLPERLDASSAHCQRCPFRWSCQGDALYTAAEIKRNEDGEEVIEVEEGDLLDLQAEILEIKDLKRQLSDREKEINDNAKKIIGAPQKILVAGRSVNWYEYDRSSFDRAQLKKEHPEIEKKYVKHKKVEALRWD